MYKFHVKQYISIVLIFLLSCSTAHSASSDTVCIVGAGIGGASVAHFLRQYSTSDNHSRVIRLFERSALVGGRMATVNVSGETFEAGASILHPKNYHTLNYTNMLGLKGNFPEHSNDESTSLGIWDGHGFVFKTMTCEWKSSIARKLVEVLNEIRIVLRYGVVSLMRMNSFVEGMLNKFLKYYEGFESRPVFETVEDMLKWAGLYNLTTGTLGEELVNIGLSPVLIDELVTVITRINYGQSVNISGLAGAVSLASGGGLWSVEGGNWQMAAGLINRSDVDLHLNEEIKSVSYLGDYYELNSTSGNSYRCQVTVVTTPLDEVDIQFSPEISIPERKLQHTHATFVRGLLNPAYFGLKLISDIPDLVGTLESSSIPFSSISVLKQHENDITYKVFSRQPMSDALLDDIFSLRVDTVRINWGAYPHYHAPEKYAPFILDNRHLYYVNAFENAASTMETSAVAAENIARLILSRLSGKVTRDSLLLSSSNDSSDSDMHVDL